MFFLGPRDLRQERPGCDQEVSIDDAESSLAALEPHEGSQVKPYRTRPPPLTPSSRTHPRHRPACVARRSDEACSREGGTSVELDAVPASSIHRREDC